MESNFVDWVRSVFRERIEEVPLALFPINEKCVRKKKTNAFGEIIIN